MAGATAKTWDNQRVMTTALDPNITLLIIATLNAATAWLAYRTHKLTKQVEIATNSMQDALVAATGEAAHAAGKEEGRIAGEVKAANVAEGKLEVGNK